jgi:phage shock protein A
MADLQVLNTLNAKRQTIEAYIADMERKIEEARSDLAHVLATIRLFAGDGERVTA